MGGLLRSVGRGLLRLPRPARAALVLVWMALIWTLSSTARTGSEPSLGWGVVENLAHAPLFGLLALFLVPLLLGRGPAEWPRVEGRAGALVLLCVGTYGVIDELHQALTPGRDASIGDVVTDVVGAAAVLWIIAYLGRGDADERGLRRRLLGGVTACVASALGATLLG